MLKRNPALTHVKFECLRRIDFYEIYSALFGMEDQMQKVREFAERHEAFFDRWGFVGGPLCSVSKEKEGKALVKGTLALISFQCRVQEELQRYGFEDFSRHYFQDNSLHYNLTYFQLIAQEQGDPTRIKRAIAYDRARAKEEEPHERKEAETREAMKFRMLTPFSKGKHPGFKELRIDLFEYRENAEKLIKEMKDEQQLLSLVQMKLKRCLRASERLPTAETEEELFKGETSKPDHQSQINKAL